ncbi:MAG: L-seryl-tRNA(Sec) selenium transferase [Bacteroidetes bacterium HGW-Bacteroidetes-21]|jgi:L-seryl-tRNA(Ser) seleniumtransferase|nr:MAG: L-seryl-tRNA(Sec) selenium transferase [Bacteroidetes bacterium HGW-Bacteroidetes-21]
MKSNKEDYKRLPAVDKLLSSPEVKSLISKHGKELVTFAIRQSLLHFRDNISNGQPAPDDKAITEKILSLIMVSGSRSLKKVYNATGVIIHTNLGRAPYGEFLLNDVHEILCGYNNLEFNLEKGVRGSRNDHATSLVKYITGAEDALIVNNNAAAVMLVLRAFAKNKEVVVSRGELVEIGGSFRIPEIMAASDCKMVEVGTTNKTHVEDYEKIIGKETAMLFKAHKSNYVIKGFTQEVGLEELVVLGRKNKIPVLFDQGCGLLSAQKNPLFSGEPDVRTALKKGVDLICFSGDKLLGGPQAGIIVGNKKLIAKLKKEPMLRALRVCKSTIALLEATLLNYLNETDLTEKNQTFKFLTRKSADIKATAEFFKNELTKAGISAEVTTSKGQCGGGTLPDKEIPSFTVVIKQKSSNKLRSDYAEKMYHALLNHETPVLGILKKGNICFDMLTLYPSEAKVIAQIICDVHQQVKENRAI